MTLEEAKERLAPVAESEQVQHILANDDGTYSVVGHIKFTICNYCLLGASGITEHVAKSDIYEGESSPESSSGYRIAIAGSSFARCGSLIS